MLFEYPVYVSDLRLADFDVVSLGSTLIEPDARGLVRVPSERLAAAAGEVIDLLQDAARRQASASKNFESARRLYSYEALEKIVRGLFAARNIPWNSSPNP